MAVANRKRNRASRCGRTTGSRSTAVSRRGDARWSICPAGAKSIIEDADALGSKLKLAFSRDARTGRSCEVMWRRGNNLGVASDSSVSPQD
jgi:hypothetical protein